MLINKCFAVPTVSALCFRLQCGAIKWESKSFSNLTAIILFQGWDESYPDGPPSWAKKWPLYVFFLVVNYYLSIFSMSIKYLKRILPSFSATSNNLRCYVTSQQCSCRRIRRYGHFIRLLVFSSLTPKRPLLKVEMFTNSCNAISQWNYNAISSCPP